MYFPRSTTEHILAQIIPETVMRLFCIVYVSFLYGVYNLFMLLKAIKGNCKIRATAYNYRFELTSPSQMLHFLYDPCCQFLEVLSSLCNINSL